MKKLILGIIAVFCLQVGFIIYNAPNEAAYSLAKINGNTQGEPVIQIEGPSVEGEPLVAFDTSEDEAFQGLLTDSDSPDDIRPILAGRREVRPQPVKVVARDLQFRPVVITIPASKPVEFRLKNEYAAVVIPQPAESYNVVTVEVPRSENRSLLSKAIRKPYDWIKALGSKVKDIH